MMKKIFTLSLVSGLLLAALLIQPASSARAQGPGFVSALFSRMDKAHRSLKSLRANIGMVRYNAQLRDEDKYQGFVLYIPQFYVNQPIRVAHGLLVAVGCLWLAAGIWRSAG